MNTLLCSEVVAYAEDGDILVGTTAKRQVWAGGKSLWV